jgi:hypothetical protein
VLCIRVQPGRGLPHSDVHAVGRDREWASRPGFCLREHFDRELAAHFHRLAPPLRAVEAAWCLESSLETLLHPVKRVVFARPFTIRITAVREGECVPALHQSSLLTDVHAGGAFAGWVGRTLVRS